MKANLRLLHPLDEFYQRAGKTPPSATQIDGKDMPEPYRQLLVHDADMTPRLEKRHGGRIGIRVLEKRRAGDAYARKVVLTMNGSGMVVEFGAITIHLQHFPIAAREQVLEGKRPLGAILAENHITHRGQPGPYFRVRADAPIAEALGIARDTELFGRRNRLLDQQGNALADVVEILPPAK